MPLRRIDLSVSPDEFEDHRNGLTDMTKEVSNGFRLEPEYWVGRAAGVQTLLKRFTEHNYEE